MAATEEADEILVVAGSDWSVSSIPVRRRFHFGTDRYKTIGSRSVWLLNIKITKVGLGMQMIYQQRRCAKWFFGLLSLSVVSFVHAQRTYTAVDLGVPPVPAYNGVFVDQINASGEVAGSFYDAGQPFVVTGGNRGALPVLHLNMSGQATGINAAGLTIGFSCISYYEQCHAVEWSNDGVPSELASAEPFLPHGINSTGEIVGDTQRSGGGLSFPNSWLNGKLTGLPQGTFQPANGGNAYAINDSGVIVGELCEPTRADGFTNCHAVEWTGSTVKDLHADAAAFAINSGGQVVGYARAPDGIDLHAASWTAEGFTDLGAPNDYQSVASAVNDAGVIVGSGTATGYDESHAMRWVNGVMSDLNDLVDPKLPKQILLLEAVSINDSGQILVNGTDTSTGLSHAFILSPSGTAPAAEPTFSVIPRSYASTQTVAIADSTAAATIRYTLDGTQPTSTSAIYTSALTIDRTTTIRATAYIDSYQPSSSATGSFEIISGAGTVAVNFQAPNTLAIAQQGPPVAYGLDGLGNVFASELIGNALVWSGVQFNLNQGSELNGVADTELALPSGKFTSIKLVATGSRGNRPHETFTVTYTDGSKDRIVQGVSDWATPQSYPGESTALTMNYRINKTGVAAYGPYYLYGYTLPLNPSKAIKSLTLPASKYVVILAATMSGQVASNLSPPMRSPAPQPGPIRIRSE